MTMDNLPLFVHTPFEPSPEFVIREALKFAELRPGEWVYDLGSGDGEVVILATKEYEVRCVGIEFRKDLVEETLERIRKENLCRKIKIIHGMYQKIDLGKANVVYTYLEFSDNEALRPKLEKELKPGTRVVTYYREISGWTPSQQKTVIPGHELYLYKKL